MGRSKRFQSVRQSSTRTQAKVDLLDMYLGQIQDAIVTINTLQSVYMMAADRFNGKIVIEIAKSESFIKRTFEEILKIDDTIDFDDLIKEMMESLIPDMYLIDAEQELRDLQWFKFSNHGNQYENVTGTDCQFSYDTAFAKPWTSAFKPIQYSRKIKGKQTFIPNVRILAFQGANEMPIPLNVPLGYKAPEMEYTEIPKPVITGMRMKTTIRREWKIVYTGRTTRHVVSDRFWIQRGQYERSQCMPQGTLELQANGRKKFKMHKVRVPSKCGFKFGSTKTGEKTVLSVQLAPPVERNEKGEVTAHYGYSSDPRYNLIGQDMGWAEIMRNTFLNDLREGNVNLTEFVEWRVKKSFYAPAISDNTQYVISTEQVDSEFGPRTQFTIGYMSYKQQAYRVYPTFINVNGIRHDFNVLIYCDIKQISKDHFKTLDDVKKKGFYPEVLFVQY